jgi:hypothetical protein
LYNGGTPATGLDTLFGTEGGAQQDPPVGGTQPIADQKGDLQDRYLLRARAGVWPSFIDGAIRSAERAVAEIQARA